VQGRRPSVREGQARAVHRRQVCALVVCGGAAVCRATSREQTRNEVRDHSPSLYGLDDGWLINTFIDNLRGHSITCDTLADAEARIKNTGAKGGLTG